MMILITFTVVAVIACVPVLIFVFEVAAALFVKDQSVQFPSARAAKRLVVVVPAHNESTAVIPTIADIKLQLQEGDRLIVIADNCSDDTAVVAAAAGAEVIQRNDMSRVGKGYALGWAIDHLRNDPPDLVLFIDADCRVQSDAIEKLIDACSALERPVQASFLMKSAELSPIDHGLAEFAFLVKNGVRPHGLKNLDCPVQLMGTGMIFPWEIIQSAPLANGHLVEDLKLGLDLALVGKAPRFLPSAKITSDFPVTKKGTDSQRQRWVQGHIGMILMCAPRLLASAVFRRNVELFVLASDMLVPPLILLGLFTVLIFFLTSSAALFGASLTPALIAATNLIIFSIAILLAWLNYGQQVLPARRLWSVVPAVLRKFGLLGRMLMGRTVSNWVRTDRGTGADHLPK
jgi:cellulose synthase/poly-beta-1,6-N-acetylglucosamine synthase-like glycosyltransferase